MNRSSGLMEAYHRQHAIWAKCFHPSGTFVEVTREEVEQSIPSRFEQQVAKYPDRIAVKTKNYALTYAELNQAANRVARAILAKCGEGRERIASLLEHDTPMIVSILGVFKTGKTCVPLDPGYHEARASYILEDSRAGLLITNNRNLSLAYELAQNVCPVINIDDIDVSLSTENSDLSISPGAFAYILYTSGSTGQPKGVVQNHRNLIHEAMGYTNSFHICANDRVTLFASCSGGQGIKTVLSALLNGATLCLWNVKEQGLARVASWLMTEEISICIFAASLFRNFSRTLNGTEKFPQVRLVKLGSEPVGRADAELYKRHFSPGCILVNWLACTEAGNIAHSFIDKKTEITEDVVPVGYAVEDKEVLLLDDNGKQVGFNRIGEIAVKSRYLSPGYWRRPDLTQAKFLPDPKGGDERIYLTGDLGRMHPDGCLEYMGRKDFQVKVRGYRIEAAEIEKALLQLPAIREAVVVAAEDKSGDRRLIAYLVLNSYPAASVSELRSFLKNSLPTYMVPSAFVFLDALPLAPNGKVDRRALPDPGQSRPELDMSLVLPRTPVEQELAKIWAGVLDKECVGIHDNFFDLGGDSLLAVKIISRVRDLWNVDLPLKMLFEKPTIAELAEAIT